MQFDVQWYAEKERRSNGVLVIRGAQEKRAAGEKRKQEIKNIHRKKLLPLEASTVSYQCVCWIEPTIQHTIQHPIRHAIEHTHRSAQDTMAAGTVQGPAMVQPIELVRECV